MAAQPICTQFPLGLEVSAILRGALVTVHCASPSRNLLYCHLARDRPSAASNTALQRGNLGSLMAERVPDIQAMARLLLYRSFSINLAHFYTVPLSAVHAHAGYFGFILPLLEDCTELLCVALTEHLMSGSILQQAVHAVQSQAASLTRSAHSPHLKISFQHASLHLYRGNQSLPLLFFSIPFPFLAPLTIVWLLSPPCLSCCSCSPSPVRSLLDVVLRLTGIC